MPQRQRNFLQSLRDLLASKVSVVDGIKDVSERIQFGSLILKNSGDMAASTCILVCDVLDDDDIIHVHAQKVQSYAFIASLRSKLCFWG